MAHIIKAMLSLGLVIAATVSDQSIHLTQLHAIAQQVLDASLVRPNSSIPGVGPNTTGFGLRVPGGTQTYYPAFWIRDAAMMLGNNFVSDEEVQGWIKVIASTQPGENGLRFPHGLIIPPFSIPDHITLSGQACWYPGAYTNQGFGDFGFLPPADDAYFFVQMVWEQTRLAKNLNFYHSKVKSGWGDQLVSEVAKRAFDSVEVDPNTGLVLCHPEKGQTRVDWGFCDSIHKSGLCLMPSLLRLQSAQRLQKLAQEDHNKDLSERYHSIASRIQSGIAGHLVQLTNNGDTFLLSATQLGRKEDVWGEALAVWLHALKPATEKLVAMHLVNLYRSGEIAEEGQVRHLPKTGAFGGYWEQALSGPDTYQNGGYWATATGWLIAALAKVDRRAANKLFGEYMESLELRQKDGAPFEWINPSTKSYINGKYGSSVGWVAITLNQAKWH